MTAVLACVGVAGLAPTAHAAPPPSIPVVVSGPGYVDFYWTRSETRTVLAPAVQGGPAAVAAAAGAVCAVPGSVVGGVGAAAGAVCGAAGAIYGAVEIGQINTAAANNECVEEHSRYLPFAATWFTADNGPNCNP